MSAASGPATAARAAVLRLRREYSGLGTGLGPAQRSWRFGAVLALGLLALPVPVPAETAPRLVCRMETRCDLSGCAVQALTVQVRDLPAVGDGRAVVDFGAAEHQRPVRVLRRGNAVLMTAPNGPEGGRFSLRIDGAGDALLSHASALDGGITRTGHCGRTGLTGAGT